MNSYRDNGSRMTAARTGRRRKTPLWLQPVQDVHEIAVVGVVRQPITQGPGDAIALVVVDVGHDVVSTATTVSGFSEPDSGR